MLMQVQGLQNALAAVSDTPGLGLGEAAEILQGELGVSLVCIHGFCAGEPGDPHAAVLLSACGSGAATVEKRPVVTDSAWSSCLRLRGAAAASLQASTAAGVNSLTGDWADLHRAAGLCAFLTVPIGSPDRPWGALTLASKDPNGFADARWHIWPGVAAVTLVHQLRHWETSAACQLLRRAAAAPDQIALISQLLQGAEAFMNRAANTVAHARFAVLDDTGARALIFERSPSSAAPGGASLNGSDGAHRDAVLVASEMDLSSTLLASAISMCKARFVRDCTTYMQSCARPARDVFTQPAALVASLVVVPLVHGAAPPRAALYLTLEAPNDFSNIQQPLLGFINAIIPLVFARLESRWDEVWSEARAVKSHSTRLHALRRRSRLHGDGGSSVGGGSLVGGADVASTLMLLGGGGSDDGSLGPGGGGGHRTAASSIAGAGGALLSPSVSSGADLDNEDLDLLADAAPSSQLATCNSKRLCTEAMVKAVEAEIFKAKRFGTDGGRRSGDTASWDTTGNCSTDDALVPVSSDLVLTELIGAGGFGMVWRGSWKKVTAAIKVCFERNTEHDAMRDAVEMAVLGAVTHPHIVQVFACLTDMVEVTVGMPGSKSASDLQRMRRASSRSSPLPRPRPPRYRRLLPFEDPEGTETCSVIVMEYCDLGSLRQAVSGGLIHRRVADGRGGSVLGVDLAGLLDVALEVAEAVAYLHSIRLAHCDIKLDNVMLKSAPAQPRGYIAKLGDFGLVKVLGAADASAVNVNGAGTVNHLAPELFTPGSRVTAAVDSYAFGVLLYELYMGGAHAYAGLGKRAIIERVARASMRPRFPPSAPRALVELAAACWAEDPAARPSFNSIIGALNRMAHATVMPPPPPQQPQPQLQQPPQASGGASPVTPAPPTPALANAAAAPPPQRAAAAAAAAAAAGPASGRPAALRQQSVPAAARPPSALAAPAGHAHYGHPPAATRKVVSFVQ